MLKALISTITELLDSKKAAYSFIAALGASVLHLYFGTSVQDALLLVSPLGVATISQAHVDAAAAKNSMSSSTTVTATVETSAPPSVPAADASTDAPKTDG
jgi:hypothetical protein